MDTVYIIMIVAGGVFLLLLLIYVLYAIELNKIRKKLKNSLIRAYSDKNLAKMEYDIAVYDEETNRRLNGTANTESQMTIEEVIAKRTPSEEEQENEAKFEKIGAEGVEEITGNYKSQH